MRAIARFVISRFQSSDVAFQFETDLKSSVTRAIKYVMTFRVVSANVHIPIHILHLASTTSLILSAFSIYLATMSAFYNKPLFALFGSLSAIAASTYYTSQKLDFNYEESEARADELEGTLRGHIGLIEEALDRLEGKNNSNQMYAHKRLPFSWERADADLGTRYIRNEHGMRRRTTRRNELKGYPK